MRSAGPALLVAIVLTGGLAACGDDGGDTTTSSTQPSAAGATDHAESSPDDGEPSDDSAPDDASGGEADDGPGLTPAERAAARTVRAYVEALDDRDGEAVCELLVSGATDAVEFPNPSGGCAASLDASIGYRDPRGLPVWRSARVASVASVDVSGDEAKVVATTVTEFADRSEPSIEDDVVYLERSGGDWLIAKPSSTLHRSVGVADVPPSVLAPPG